MVNLKIERRNNSGDCSITFLRNISIEAVYIKSDMNKRSVAYLEIEDSIQHVTTPRFRNTETVEKIANFLIDKILPSNDIYTYYLKCDSVTMAIELFEYGSEHPLFQGIYIPHD